MSKDRKPLLNAHISKSHLAPMLEIARTREHCGSLETATNELGYPPLQHV